MTDQPIPLIDLRAVHDPIRDELRAAFERVLDSSAFASGPEVEAFEAQLAEYVGTAHAIGVASGTAALHLALRAAGIGVGDEVILPPNTFFATLEAVVQAGATPVLADALDDTANIDPDAVAAAVTSRTAAIVPVHLYGQPADVDSLRRVADQHDLWLLEDAAQAIGATWDGRNAGTLGNAAGFSFYAGKNLGALGEAGGVTTNDAQVARRIRSLRAHGEPERYHHEEVGYNERMDGLQGAFLAVKLRHLPAWQQARDELVAQYDALLADAEGVRLIGRHPKARSVHHLYVVRVAQRDAVLDALRGRGIGAAIHYPVPLHLLDATKGLAPEGSLPVAERLATEILTLPLYPGMTGADVERCVAALLASIEETA